MKRMCWAEENKGFRNNTDRVENWGQSPNHNKGKLVQCKCTGIFDNPQVHKMNKNWDEV